MSRQGKRGMSQTERDDMLAHQVDVLKGIRHLLEGMQERPTVEAREREYTALKGLPQSPFLAGESGLRTLLDAVPEFAEIWVGDGSVQLPASHLGGVCDVEGQDELPLALCRCGAATTLTPFESRECVGRCGRWFLSLPPAVRVRMINLDRPEAA